MLRVWRGASGREKITDVLVVDLKVGDSDGVGDMWGCVGFDALEEVFAGSRDETRLCGCAHHCV